MCHKECIPAVYIKGKKKGQYTSASHGKQRAREELIKRDGPRPFPKAVCRHTCENDSMAPNGFVCVLHTVWGTQKENLDDQCPKVKSKISKIGGKKTCSIERTCPHCGRTIKGPVYFRYHGENCKFKP